jgi:hypothetical protein
MGLAAATPATPLVCASVVEAATVAKADKLKINSCRGRRRSFEEEVEEQRFKLLFETRSMSFFLVFMFFLVFLPQLVSLKATQMRER